MNMKDKSTEQLVKGVRDHLLGITCTEPVEYPEQDSTWIDNHDVEKDFYLSPIANEVVEKYRCEECGLLGLPIRRWGIERGPFCLCPGSPGEEARSRGYYPEDKWDALRD